jgi:hypothetical protein
MKRTTSLLLSTQTSYAQATDEKRTASMICAHFLEMNEQSPLRAQALSADLLVDIKKGGVMMIAPVFGGSFYDTLVVHCSKHRSENLKDAADWAARLAY